MARFVACRVTIDRAVSKEPLAVAADAARMYSSGVWVLSYQLSVWPESCLGRKRRSMKMIILPKPVAGQSYLPARTQAWPFAYASAPDASCRKWVEQLRKRLDGLCCKQNGRSLIG